MQRLAVLTVLTGFMGTALGLGAEAQSRDLSSPVTPDLLPTTPPTLSDTRTRVNCPRRTLPRCMAGPITMGEVRGRVPITPGAPGANTPTTTGNGPQSFGVGVDTTEWSLWWDFQQEPFLQMKRHLFGRDGVGTSGQSGDALGGDGRTTGTPQRVPTDHDLDDVVLPALLELLDKAESDQVIVGALVALARVGDELDSATTAKVDAAIRAHLVSSNQVVSETAVAALGILGYEPSVMLASSLMTDATTGQEALGRSAVPRRTRAYAAYALGLIGGQSNNEDVRRYAVHALVQSAQGEDEATADVAAASVLALGCVPLAAAGERPEERKKDAAYPATSRESQLLVLLELLRDRRRDQIVRCQVPSALGALLAVGADEIDQDLRREVTEELIERVGSRREAREVIQSCVAALADAIEGQPEMHARALRVLMEIEDDVVDRQARNLATMALARSGAYAGTDTAQQREDVREYLQQRVEDGNAEAHWGALALAVFERSLAMQGNPTAATSRALLVEELADAKAPLDIGAFAIACGLMQVTEAESVLQQKLEATSDDEARGYVAVALGMLGSRESAEPLHELLTTSMRRPGLLLDVGTALALVGDRTSVPELVEMLDEADTFAAQGAVAQALGRVGDRQALAPLVEHMNDPERTPNSRAFAAAALGIVADRDELPWDTRLSVITNYASAPPTLYGQGGSGILNIL